MSKTKEMDLTVGSPFRSLLKFAFPVILGNLFQLFYTLADSVIVGKTLGAESLAAVGSTSIIIYFVFCFINGFTGGFGICLGQYCGAKDEKNMRKGDLLFFRGQDNSRTDGVGHVEMYIGDGKIFGHGSGVGGTVKVMSEYCRMRQGQKSTAKLKNKGLLNNCLLKKQIPPPGLARRRECDLI